MATDPRIDEGFLVAINEWEYLIIEDDPAKNELATKDLEAIELCVGDWMAAGSTTNPRFGEALEWWPRTGVSRSGFTLAMTSASKGVLSVSSLTIAVCSKHH